MQALDDKILEKLRCIHRILGDELCESGADNCHTARTIVTIASAIADNQSQHDIWARIYNTLHSIKESTLQ